MFFRSDIQGLRALAIILVFAAHAGVQGFTGGFIGVDVFFVISGFLITGIIHREISRSGSIDFFEFYVRRLKRLLPALVVLVAMTVLAASLLLSNYEVTQQTASAAAAATLTSNFYFALSNVDYFDELRAKDFFLHTWSLGVEEQFYLIWPWLLLGMSRLFKEKINRSLKTLFVCSVVVGFFCFLYLSVLYPLHAYYLMPARAWEFFVGGLVYLLSEGRSPKIGRFGKRCGDIGILLIIGSALTIKSDYPGAWLLLPVAGCALVLWRAPVGIGGWVLTNAPMKWVGDRSYSLYLWHWPVLVFGETFGLGARPIDLVFLATCAVILSMATYRWIELPFWKGTKANSINNRQALLVAILLVGVVLLGPIMNKSMISTALQSPEASLASAARVDKPVIYKQGCDTWYSSASLNPCEIGDPRAPKTVVLIGDSVGAQWVPLLPDVFEGPQWKIVVLTKSSCPMVDEDFYYAKIGKVYNVCNEWRASALDYIDKLRPDVIIVGSAGTYDFTAEQWTEGVKRVLGRLSASTDKLVVLGPTPALAFDGPACVERNESVVYRHLNFLRKDCSEPLHANRLVLGYLKDAANFFENTTVIDTTPRVCPNGYCSAKNSDDVFVFRDSQHLTVSFVRSQSKYLRQVLFFGEAD